MKPPDLSAFGDFLVTGPMAGGNRASVWRVEDAAGRAYAARSTRRSEAQLRWVLVAQRLARQAGFRVAPYRPTSSGMLAPNDWTLEPLLEGRGAGVAEMRSLVPRIAAFHALSANLPQRPGFASCVELVEQDKGGDVDMAALPDSLRYACRAAWAPFRGRAMAGLHGDLGPGNVIFGTGGPALIDWDEARRDLPFHDLASGQRLPPEEIRAHLAFEVATCWTSEPDYARSLGKDLLASQ